jgi:hypothetical protein
MVVAPNALAFTCAARSAVTGATPRYPAVLRASPYRSAVQPVLHHRHHTQFVAEYAPDGVRLRMQRLESYG